MDRPILSVKDLTKTYGSGEAEVHALNGVSFGVADGEFVAIVGTSGSGKTTLLNMIGGLDYPTSGEIEVRGRALSGLTDEQLTVFRRRNIGFVFQNYNLIPMMNAYENIAFPIEIDGKRPDTAYIDDILTTLGIADLTERMPNQLSGGQQQRVAIARALAARPAIVLADEPTGNLDSRTGLEVILMLQEGNREYGQTTVIITHNEEIAQMAGRVIRIEDGRIASDPAGTFRINPESRRMIMEAR
jgi:putative ABC transport system ATP-binding protein